MKTGENYPRLNHNSHEKKETRQNLKENNFNLTIKRCGGTVNENITPHCNTTKLK